jgi:predicted N-acyltransferase
MDPEEWDKLVGNGRVWHRHAALRLLEESDTFQSKPRYIVFRDAQGQLIGHAPTYVVATDLLIFSRGWIRKIVEGLRRIAPRFLKPRFLECGWLVSPGFPVSYHPSIPFSDILALLGQALEEIARSEGIVFIVVRDFEDSELNLVSGLRNIGFRCVKSLPTTKIKLRWVHYDAYVAAMRKRYRYKLRKALDLATSEGLTAVVTRQFSDLYSDLSIQWNNINDHARELRLEPLTPAFYRGIDENLDCELVQILKGNKMIAHALICRDGRLLRWVFFGRSQAHTRDGAYFLAINTIIRLAIEEGYEEIETGLTTYLPKMHFGAQMIPLSMFIRIRSFIPLGSLVPLFGVLNPVPAIQRREIFRE